MRYWYTILNISLGKTRTRNKQPHQSLFYRSVFVCLSVGLSVHPPVCPSVRYIVELSLLTHGAGLHSIREANAETSHEYTQKTAFISERLSFLMITIGIQIGESFSPRTWFIHIKVCTLFTAHTFSSGEYI